VCTFENQEKEVCGLYEIAIGERDGRWRGVEGGITGAEHFNPLYEQAIEIAAGMEDHLAGIEKLGFAGM